METGDIIIVLDEADNQHFSRKGSDLFYNMVCSHLCTLVSSAFTASVMETLQYQVLYDVGGIVEAWNIFQGFEMNSEVT